MSETPPFDLAPTRSALRVDRLRALNIPVPVIVVTDGNGLPLEIVETAAANRRVAEILEVWRVDDEWWRKPVSRRYLEVALEGGGHVVLFEDLITGSWFLQMP